MELSATSEMTRNIAAVAVGILSNVTIGSSMPSAGVSRSIIVAVSIPPGRTITVSRLPVGIVGSGLVIISTPVGHIYCWASHIEVASVSIVAVDVESPAPIVLA